MRNLLVLLLFLALPVPVTSGLSQALSAAAGQPGQWPERSDGSGLDNALRRGVLRMGFVTRKNPRAEEWAGRIAEHYHGNLTVQWVQTPDPTAALKRDLIDATTTAPYTLPGGYLSSELAEVLSAAFREVDPERYADLYQKYLGVRRLPPEGEEGRWIERPTPGSTLDRVLTAKKLRIGYWQHAPYQFDGKGFEKELGDEMVRIMARHYPGLTGEWVERTFVSDGRGAENLLLFDKLAPELIRGDFDVLFTGVIQRPDRPVGVAAPDLAFFWTAVYTGKDNLDVREVVNTDRDHFVEWLVAHPGCTLLSTPGGPSEDTAKKLVADVQARGGKASAAGATVPNLITASREKSVHFIVGDAIALSDMAMKQGTNLNIVLRGGEWMAPMTALDP